MPTKTYLSSGCPELENKPPGIVRVTEDDGKAIDEGLSEDSVIL